MRSAIKNIDVLCKPSVYLLYDKGTLVYVGQSKTPESRVLQHRASKTFDSFKILRCRPDRRKYWEDVLMSKFRPKYNKSTNNGSRSPVKKKKSIPIQTAPVCWYTLGDGFMVSGTASNLFIPRGDATGDNNHFRFHNGVMSNELKGVFFGKSSARFEKVVGELKKKEREQKKRAQKEGH